MISIIPIRNVLIDVKAVEHKPRAYDARLCICGAFIRDGKEHCEAEIKRIQKLWAIRL